MLVLTVKKIGLLIKAKKSFLLNSSKVFIGVGLLYYLVIYIKPESIVETFTSADYRYLALAAGLMIVNIMLQYLKWRELCKSLLNVQERKPVLYSLFYGFSAGITTPFRAGEYFGRAIPFKGKSMLKITIATFIDKLFPLIIVTFTGSIASILFLKKFYDIPDFMVWVLILITIVLYSVFLILMNNRSFWKNLIFRKLKGIKLLSNQVNKLKVLTQLNNETTNRLSFFSLLFIITYTVQLTLLVTAFSNTSDFLYFFWAGNLVMFTKSMIPSFTFGELGIREGVAIFFFSAMGVENSAVFNASLVLFLINIVFPSIIGLFLLTKKS